MSMEHKDRAIIWHGLWKANNSPHTGIIADIRRKTRSKYHQALKWVKHRSDTISADRMAQAMLEGNSRAFWTEVKKHRKVRSPTPHRIDEAEGCDQISDMFANKFNRLYNSVKYDSNESPN